MLLHRLKRVGHCIRDVYNGAARELRSVSNKVVHFAQNFLCHADHKVLLVNYKIKGYGEHLTAESLFLSGMATGEAIKKYLQTAKRGNPYTFYKIFRQFKETISYASVSTFFYILKEIGLIRPAGTEPSKQGWRKHMYEITPGKEKDPAWAHAERELYPDTRLKKKDYAKLEAKGLKPHGGRARKYRGRPTLTY